jgi:hypothetical protein
MPELLPESFTLSLLATIPGASAFTFLVVAFFKDAIDRWLKFPTLWFAAVVGTITLYVSNGMLGGGWLNGQVILESIANGMLAALVSGKINDVAIEVPKIKDPWIYKR